MKTILVVILVIAVALGGNIRQRVHYEYAFEEFIRSENKIYSTAEEYIYRLQIFADNLDKIEIHNSAPSTYQLGVNRFSDLTRVEFESSSFCGGLLLNKRINKSNVQKLNNIAANDIDWTTKGAVTQVKDQAACGSCWAFSATGSLESAYFLKNNKMVEFSEQQLVDCSTSYGNMGCNGGLMTYAFDYVKDNGLCTETDYPYHGRDEKCKTCTKAVDISGYVELDDNEVALAQGVTQQPISVALNASPIQSYTKGIFSGVCNNQLNHGVLAVGYGEENGVKFWKVKNSWGKTWGESGYFRIKKDVTQQYGLCGIAMMTVYPKL